ncbi:MAG: 16S rRNA (cytosine(1402)-N(4))-methyltransferase RsmH [Planctomycetaceae bacterium]|nr:16S rRNA (cytosine(1402)-N(4))-methyltransferase RsmH [Planctomycetaceae bacterium]
MDHDPAAAAPKTTVPSVHVPVMMREVLRGLELAPGLTVVDGTVGGGGHSKKICEQIGPTGQLIGIDRDPTMLDRARAVLPTAGVSLHRGSYVELPEFLKVDGITAVDRILVDLGLSSDQLADRNRGFSFHADGPLDLRFHAEGPTAAEFLAKAPEAELEKIFHDYGEEPHARGIAAAIVRQRATHPIVTALDLAELVETVTGHKGRNEKHPATRVFQALRLAVNRELEHVQKALAESFPASLRPGGLLVVISFHSLEDRIVKDAFRDATVWDVVTPKPILPTPTEERVNPRSRSAKIRIARRR